MVWYSTFQRWYAPVRCDRAFQSGLLFIALPPCRGGKRSLRREGGCRASKGKGFDSVTKLFEKLRTDAKAAQTILRFCWGVSGVLGTITRVRRRKNVSACLSPTTSPPAPPPPPPPLLPPPMVSFLSTHAFHSTSAPTLIARAFSFLPRRKARSPVRFPGVGDDRCVLLGLRHEPPLRRGHRGRIFVHREALRHGDGPGPHRSGHHAAQYLPALRAGALPPDRPNEPQEALGGQRTLAVPFFTPLFPCLPPALSFVASNSNRNSRGVLIAEGK